VLSAETKPEQDLRAHAGARELLRADAVSKVFGSRRSWKSLVGRAQAPVHAVGPLDLTVSEGEFLAVVGPSGCGKSTLLRLLAGLIPVSGGAVHRDPDLLGPGAVSMVFQTPALLPWRTTMGNVLVSARLPGRDRAGAKRRAAELLELVGLERFHKALPHELSGGMQQRVAVCRALVAEPRVLLMDEPFGALDAITREQLAWDLQRIWMESRNSVVFVTHSVEEALLLADRVVVMTSRPGRIAAVFSNDTARPRPPATLTDPGFVERASRVRAALQEAMGQIPAARAPLREAR
jgi:NitT/TauT family transport system ATP-binding protein